MSKNMKVIMENWNGFIKENRDGVEVFYEACRNNENKKQKLIKESAIDVDTDKLKFKISPVGKWAALTAMTGITANAALSAFALQVGGAVGVAFFLSSNAVTLAILGGLAYVWYKMKTKMPNWLKKALAKFDKEKDPTKRAEDKIKKMIDSVSRATDITQDDAAALLGIVNKEVHEDEKCKQITEDLLKAIEEDDGDAIVGLTDKLDVATNAVIERLQKELVTMGERSCSVVCTDPDDELPDTLDTDQHETPRG